MDENTQPIFVTGHDSPLTRRTPPNGMPNIGMPNTGAVYLGRPGNEDLVAAAVGAVRAEYAIREQSPHVHSQLEMYRAVLAQLIEEGLISLPSARESEVRAVIDTATEQSRKLACSLARTVRARAQQAVLIHTMTEQQAKGAEIAAKWIDPPVTASERKARQ